MSRISRSALALGAVFFALTISACGDDLSRAATSPRSTTSRSPRTRTTAGSRLASTSQPGAVVARPADVHQVRRRQGEGRARARQGPAEAQALGLPQAVQAGVRPAQAAGHDVPHPLDLARGRGRQARASRSPTRRPRPRFEKARQAGVPEEGRLREVPQDLRPDRGRPRSTASQVQLLEQKITDEDPERAPRSRPPRTSRTTTRRTTRSSSRSRRRVTCASS